MAGQDSQFHSAATSSYLSPNQQDLLLAALSSQAGAKSNIVEPAAAHDSIEQSASATTTNPLSTSAANNLSRSHFASPQTVDMDAFNVDYTPDLDDWEGDNSFDFENADLGGEMIGALPGSGADANGELAELHEKRKNPDDDDSSEEGDSKRQETQEGERGAKKPGRKPLTSEPTTKRKAQNRAAQRAFRERKEKHVKDLETKVSELTKASEADKHENGLLKAQVERLSVELRESRKRLALDSANARRSPTLTSGAGQQRSNSGASQSGNFQFDFPKFGALPGSQIFGNPALQSSPSPITQKSSSSTPPTTQSPSDYGQQKAASREASGARSMSPTSLRGSISHVNSPGQIANLNPSFAAYSTNNNMHGFASTLSEVNGGQNPFGDLFSPSILKSASVDDYFDNTSAAINAVNTDKSYTADNGGDTTAGLNRVFQFNSGSSISDGTSPSASSSSQWNANGMGNSSCGTSPEPSHDSPMNKDKNIDASGDASSLVKRRDESYQQSNLSSTLPTDLNSSYGFANGDFNLSSVGSFDPVLFGDYRESQDAINGGADFNNGFFDDALNSIPMDYSSPSNLFGILQSPQETHQALLNSSANAPLTSRELMAEVERARNGGDDDYGLPQHEVKKAEGSRKLISCNNIWNQLQSNPDFQEGKFDLDGLCSELRVKARCSESGVMVDQDHVDAALRKLGKKDQSGKEAEPAPLMFEAASWENVVNKMRGNSTA